MSLRVLHKPFVIGDLSVCHLLSGCDLRESKPSDIKLAFISGSCYGNVGDILWGRYRLATPGKPCQTG